jgi:conserved domain protein
MIIKSIQIKDNDISIAYQKPSATGLTDVFTLKSKDDPRPELLQAFGKLHAIVKKILSSWKNLKFHLL